MFTIDVSFNLCAKPESEYYIWNKLLCTTEIMAR